VKEGKQQVTSGPAAGDVPLTSTLSRHDCATISLIRSPHIMPSCLSVRTIHLVYCFFSQLQALFCAFSRSLDQTRMSVAITGLCLTSDVTRPHDMRLKPKQHGVVLFKKPWRLMKPAFARLHHCFLTSARFVHLEP
jgi:hypothetical protein